MNLTCEQLLSRGCDSNIAVQAPERPNLSYSALRDLASRTKATLHEAGVAHDDRVAIVLPNGPEMATAFVTIAAVAITAPLNPNYTQEEFEFYMQDLNAKALVIEQKSASPAVAAARKLGIGLIELSSAAQRPAGDFDLLPEHTQYTDAGLGAEPASQLSDNLGNSVAKEQDANIGAVAADNIALILHTSGTTSRPKIVPLSHKNICRSAQNIASGLNLKEDDACLNIMPLFHIHGLIAAVLSTLSVGGRIYCSPGFNALKFFNWLDDAKPSWYTAVPTMHQTILSRAKRNNDVINANPLKFIRSSSASLPSQVMTELAQAFNVPVIEAYGMTEAAHQMASNPLPPGEQKPGSVGLPAGPEVEIMNQAGDILAQGEVGEIVIRGENVTAGYENNPKANAENFTNGWFRTGDQGVKDSDGYIALTGRLKEIINRGGEKISPREVDEVLMDHELIEQCVTFAVNHPKLGEDVAAAVVLKDGAAEQFDVQQDVQRDVQQDAQQDIEQDIKAFASQRLADFKVPGKILILDEIPKGATGKLQRIGLADKLGLN